MDYEGYTVSLALFDYIPVGFSVIALYFLTKRISTLIPELKSFATMAWIFTCSAGILKATWKLLLSASDQKYNFLWMSDQLFFMLFIGLSMMAMAVIWSNRESPSTSLMHRRWLMVLIPLAIVIGFALYLKFSNPESRVWNYMLLGLSTIANLVLSITLIRQAKKEQLTLAAILIALNLIGVFLLSGLGRIEDQTSTLQWIAEAVNTFAQGAFLYGVWLMYNNTKNSVSHQNAGAA